MAGIADVSMIILLNAGLGYILRVFDTNGWLFLTPVAAVVVPTMVPLPPTAYPLVGAVKNLLKSDYPPPKEVAFRLIIEENARFDQSSPKQPDHLIPLILKRVEWSTKIVGGWST